MHDQGDVFQDSHHHNEIWEDLMSWLHSVADPIHKSNANDQEQEREVDQLNV